MNKQEYMDKSNSEFVHVYNRFNLVLDHGEGTYLYDTDGKEYLDFGAGIAVNGLGHHNREWCDAVRDQVDKLTHTSNLFYNVPVINAAERLIRLSGMDKVFFTNSGAEAIEGALKAAKKYGFRRDGKSGHEIIAMNHSFHGRTVGALSVTGNAHYREPFEPLMGGVKFADFNDLDSVKAQVTDKTIAIIMEPVQGEGGIYPATEEFVKGVRALCDERDIVLIFDEIQCGVGRTGYMYAWQKYGVKPDILTSAKAIGNGVPVGAFMMTDKMAASSLEPGDHGTTYGGNPFIGTAVDKTLEIMERDDVFSHVREISTYLEEKLDELVEKSPVLTTRRGMGLMQGVVCTVKVSDVVSKCIENGLIVLSAGSDVIRLVPPLIIEKEHVDRMVEILEKVLENL